MRQWIKKIDRDVDVTEIVIAFLFLLLGLFIIIELNSPGKIDLSNITPFLIGVGLIYIAAHQHKTNKDRLRMELFDRRFKVYEAMVDLVTTEIITADDIRKYAIRSAQAKFVFKKDVQDALAKVSLIAVQIATIMEQYPEISNLIEMTQLRCGNSRLDGLCIELIDESNKATKVFEKHLTLKA